MKKILILVCLALGLCQVTKAQVTFGIKGGINYNSDSFENVKDDVFSGTESKTGFHGGIWVRTKIPFLGLYIQPELVYTQLENQLIYTQNGTTNAQVTTFKLKKIDVPVLFGKKIFGVGNIFVGPSFQYILNSNFGFNDLQEVNSDGFTVGLQLGAGIEFAGLGLDVRWERNFSDVESSFLDGTSSVEFDTRVNQIIVGLSYGF